MLSYRQCVWHVTRGEKQNVTKFTQEHPALSFTLKTVFYFAVILLLVYLYGYYGAGQEPFIYNEF